jgi:3-methyl-2-oxobutanoate hydroxymethyltransferase
MTVQEFVEKKKRKEPIAMLTAYDAPTARLLGEAGVDAILVGDSLGNVFQGRNSTREVTLRDMCYHRRQWRGNRQGFHSSGSPPGELRYPQPGIDIGTEPH